MENPQLRDKNVVPSKEGLQQVLGDSFSVFNEMMQIITNPEYGLTPQWNYYNDGKAWLCKVCYKKKTIFWLSVWDKFFKAAIYFSEEKGRGIADLNIDKNIKSDFKQSKPSGKLFPLIINMSRREQITDLLKIIEYKKSLK